MCRIISSFVSPEFWLCNGRVRHVKRKQMRVERFVHLRIFFSLKSLLELVLIIGIQDCALACKSDWIVGYRGLTVGGFGLNDDAI